MRLSLSHTHTYTLSLYIYIYLLHTHTPPDTEYAAGGLRNLAVDEKNEEAIQIGNFGKPSGSAKSRMIEMDDLLEETAAFRRFYMRSNLKNLIQTIELE